MLNDAQLPAQMHDFTKAPSSLHTARSGFDLTHSHTTTFNTGDLVPILVDGDILPGDTININVNAIIRGITPIVPVMDNTYLQFDMFFVPYRLVWCHFKNFMGESDQAWTPSKEYTIPQDTLISTNPIVKSNFYKAAGIPTGELKNSIPLSISALISRAYGLIWNEWYRDQNTQDPLYIPTDDNSISVVQGQTNNFQSTLLDGFLKVNKLHDYFTSSLPAPQKGDLSSVGLSGNLPVLTGVQHSNLTSMNSNARKNGFYPLSFAQYNGSFVANPTTAPLRNKGGSGTGITSSGASGLTNGSSTTVSANATVAPDNLYVNLANTSITINALREAFAIQQLFEIDARSGSRYREVVQAHFSTTIPDARAQIPEYLGGKVIPINISEVLSTSESESSTLGTAGANSRTFATTDNITYSATEHGVFFVLVHVRNALSYYQGVPRMFTRKNRLDFYWPSLANIGEQPVFNKELFFTGSSADDEVFGYQEAWASYRYKSNRVSGLMTPDADLGSYTYTEDFNQTPTLSSAFMTQNRSNVDRSLAVHNSDQWLSQFVFDYKLYRVRPMYSIPGLQEL